MPIKEEYIDEIVSKALDELYKNDIYLIAHEPQGRIKATDAEKHNHESAIVFRFGYYLNNIIHTQNTPLSGYHLDCEYNRNMDMVKALASSQRNARPDLIVHERGNNDKNVLVMEFKGWWKPNTDDDIKKLKDFTNQAGTYKYQYGISIVFKKKRANCCIKWVVKGCVK